MALAGILRQSTAVDILLGPFVDDADGKTAEAGLTLDVEVSKNGQALANKNDATTPVHDAAGDIDGYYNCELDTTDTGTLGTLTVVAYAAGALPVRVDYAIITAQVWDSFFSTDLLDVNAAQWLGTACAAPTVAGVPEVDVTHIGGVAQSATDLKDFADTGYDPTAHKVQGVVLTDTTTTNTDMVGTDNAALASVLGAAVGASISADIAAVKAETVLIVADTDELQTDDYPTTIAAVKTDTAAILVDTAVIGALGAGLTAVPWNAAWDAEVQSEVQDALVANDLDHLIQVDAAAEEPTDGSYLDQMMHKAVGQTFDATTDSLEAIRDNQAGADAAAIADAVWDEAMADHVTAAKFGMLQALLGKWEITANQLILYDLAGTAQFTFNLTQGGTASQFNPDLRTPV